MPDQATSPAASENELDISKVLLQEADDAETGRTSRRQKFRQIENFNMMNDDAGGDSDDETFIAIQQASVNRRASNLKGRTVKKGGGFQAMGLNANLLKAIARKGFSVPTPIQRKTIPLLLDDRDVVGMARTGSGKTAAFVIPMIEKLKGHSAKVGSRALILSPSRELALQILKVVKELVRGTDLKPVLLVGGDRLEEQFGYMAGNPDIVIATPGRFLHLKAEMKLDLSSVRYVVFDEADRLFEMGFAAQLTEILHALPSSRQTLLFSATLPKSLVEFARAGLQDPVLIRLDAESKISPDLQNAFFTVKSAEKEAALLHILHEIIKVPTGITDAAKRAKETAEIASKNPKKRKRIELGRGSNPHESPTEYSTIIFAATKHHVDYLASLLHESGFAVSYAYGSLDQTARKIQVQNFRSGITNILVVTDVAARGIDIPILANVINYDFPPQPKIFVHRVGRTARAGQKGWSYSLVCDSDAPYLLDLQLFLGRRLVLGQPLSEQLSYTDDVVVGSMPRDLVARHCELVTKILDEVVDIRSQRCVAVRAEKLYMKTRNSASSESAKRAKTVVRSDEWMMLHHLFTHESIQLEAERARMLARVGGYKPQETVFEIGCRRGHNKCSDEAIGVMKKARLTLESKRTRIQSNGRSSVLERVPSASASYGLDESGNKSSDSVSSSGRKANRASENISPASDSELEVTFSYPQRDKEKSKRNQCHHDLDPRPSFKNPEYFMSYTPASNSLVEDRAYGVHSGSNSNFVEASRNATMDLAGDENTTRGFGEPRSIMRWDKRQKKYVSRRNDEDGSKSGKGCLVVRGEGGNKIASSFRSGRFEAWKRDKRIVRVPRVGEVESKATAALGSAPSGRRYRHRKEQAPKPADKLRGDYEKKKQKVDAARMREAGRGFGSSTCGSLGGRGVIKSEIRNVDDVRKARKLKEKRREKNARPSRKAKGKT